MIKKRIEIKQADVTFIEESHQYFLPDGTELSGITSVIDRQLFPDTYAEVNEAVLIQAAMYGSQVHADIQLFDSEWQNSGTVEVADYIDICKDNNFIHEASEYLITDGSHYASMIDKLFRLSEDEFIIADIKTYGVLTPEKREKGRWQLSLYAYLFELQNPKAKVNQLYIIHLRNKQKKDGAWDHIAKLIPISRIPSDVCKELLRADAAGEQFHNPYSIPDTLREKEELIRWLILTKQEAEEKLAVIKSEIMQEMQAQDVKTWATDTMRITRKAASTRQSFNLTAFREANPTLDLSDYMRVSQVSESLQIAV